MPWLPFDPATAVPPQVVMLGAPKLSVGLTLGVLRARLIRGLGNRSDVATDLEQLDEWINEGYRYLCSMVLLPETALSYALPIVGGSSAYMLPIDTDGHCVVAAIKQISIQDTATYPGGGSPIDFIDVEQFRLLPNRSAEATAAVRFGDILTFWPSPPNARTVLIEGFLRVSDLVLPDDSPRLPREWHRGVLLAARLKALEDLREWQEAELVQNALTSHIRPLVNYAGEEEASRENHIAIIRSPDQLRRSGMLGRAEECD